MLELPIDPPNTEHKKTQNVNDMFYVLDPVGSGISCFSNTAIGPFNQVRDSRFCSDYLLQSFSKALEQFFLEDVSIS